MYNKLITGIIISTIALVGVFALTTPAAAQQKGVQNRMEECFTDQDTDNNGSLSLEEFTAGDTRWGRPHTSEMFTEIDKDGDKQITLAELQQNREDHRSRMRQCFSGADSNQDGKLSKSEFVELRPPRGNRNPEARFEEWDENNDGILQLSELPDRPFGRGPGKGICDGTGKGRGNGKGMRQGRGRGMGRGMDRNVPRFTPEERLERHDLNKDGQVTRDEFLEFHDKFRSERKDEMFERMDENSDGFLDEDEMRPPHPGNFGKGMRGRGECRFGFNDDDEDQPWKSRRTVSDGPAGYRLLGNSPNPFNSTTTISYEIPEAAQVVLKVYNINGQEVATLVNELQGANRYDVKFNISDLTSGVYFYHLQAGDFSAINRMLYIK